MRHSLITVVQTLRLLLSLLDIFDPSDHLLVTFPIPSSDPQGISLPQLGPPLFPKGLHAVHPPGAAFCHIMTPNSSNLTCLLLYLSLFPLGPPLNPFVPRSFL